MDATDARGALLGGLIDHAPLFPPASLALRDALAEDRRARESRAAFMLGRFVCPASCLAELSGLDRSLSVVADSPVGIGADDRIEAVEVPPGGDVEALRAAAPEVYAELPLDDELESRLDALSALGLRAKVRCGGAASPSVAELGRFLRACRERALEFKATAGLHHAVRQDGEHGFLNLLAAVTFGDEEAALAETDEDAFSLDREAFGWRDRSARPTELARVRRERLHSIGSCSFAEPVEELERLGLLPR